MQKSSILFANLVATAKTKKVIFLFLAFALSCDFFCQDFSTQTISIETERLPLIKSLEQRDKDAILLQFDSELEQSNIDVRGGKIPEISFYAYRAKKNDTVAKIAARLCLISDAFVVINGIASQDEELEGRLLIFPTAKGLFIPDPEKSGGGESQLEILLQKNRFPAAAVPEIKFFEIGGRNFVFFLDENFTPTERAFFLDPAMTVPVKNFSISSRFGNREDPFGSGLLQMHKGLDMAVPQGTEVVACKSGRVSGIGEDEVYGKWILIEHAGGMSSFYAHLSSVEGTVQNGKFVRGGEPIARSGSTGKVTGPHLHFEVRKNGGAVDPVKQLRLK